MSNNYDAVAGSYDLLSKLIFGNAIKQSQVCLLPFIPPQSNILIAGGGTGWILEELVKIHSTGLKIMYVEASPKMIELTAKRNTEQNKISLICLPIEAYTTSEQYDVIITPYLFDNFIEQEATQIFYHLHHMLRSNGQWLFSDFYINDQTSKSWQKMMLKTMYLFFRVVCNIQSRQLIDMNIFFEKAGYKNKYVDFYYKKFIRCGVWQKV